MAAILEMKHVTKRFGGITAVQNVSFTLNEQEIVGLIGPNGAGKTTLFNVITGTTKADAGGDLHPGEICGGEACLSYCPREHPAHVSNRQAVSRHDGV